MNKNIILILSMFILTISFSDIDKGFEFYKRNFETSILLKTPVYPLAGVGTKVDFSYKVYRDRLHDVYLLLGSGVDYTYYKNIITSIPKEIYHHLGFYLDLRGKGNVGINNLSAYGGGQIGILTDFEKPYLYAGGYLGVQYYFLTAEIGANTSNYFYAGIGVKF